MKYEAAQIEGIKANDRRQVVFLKCDGDGVLNGESAFEGFSDKHKNMARSRFEHWIDGNVHDLYFHGWNEDQRKQCFVFKWHEGRSRCRLYGFLFRPGGPRYPRLEVCVLAIFAKKFAEETDPAIIAKLNQLRIDPSALKALGSLFFGNMNVGGREDGSAKELGKKATPKLGVGKR